MSVQPSRERIRPGDPRSPIPISPDASNTPMDARSTPLEDDRFGPRSFAGAPVYWINLDRRADRRRHMEAQLAAWSGPVHRIGAVDGRRIPRAEVLAYQARLAPERQRFPLAQLHGELGCIRGHQEAMRTAIAADRYPFVVLEDDASPQADWWGDVPPAHWQVAMLGGRPPDGIAAPVEEGWRRLDVPRWITTVGYAVASESAARQLLTCWLAESAPAHLPTYVAAPPRVTALRMTSDIHVVPAGRRLPAPPSSG